MIFVSLLVLELWSCDCSPLLLGPQCLNLQNNNHDNSTKQFLLCGNVYTSNYNISQLCWQNPFHYLYSKKKKKPRENFIQQGQALCSHEAYSVERWREVLVG